MINVLMCVYKSGDVLPLTLEQLLRHKAITRILIADGPHLGHIKPGAKVDTPSVKEVVDSFNNKKIHYEYTDYLENRARKNNHILPNANKCGWILTVDSDEVYHEKDLERLVRFLRKGPKYDRYSIQTINPYPDFFHEFRIPDFKPRLYRYIRGCKCPDQDRMHQYVFHNNQKQHPKARLGMAELDVNICQIYHLNALRNPEPSLQRVKKLENGKIVWHGGKETHHSEIYPLDESQIPKAILDLKRPTL